MSINKLAGIIFANLGDEKLPELTAHRSLGSVPFGGKYRLIDFALSNMSNSGINNVGIVAKNNFHSLMDHIGSGRAWDLSKRRSGVSILSPYNGTSFENRIMAMYQLHGYFEHLKEEYILISSCECIQNFDYQKFFNNHLKKKADISIAYQKMTIPENETAPLALTINDEGKITDMLIKFNSGEECNMAVSSVIIKKDLLMNLVKKCVSANTLNFRQNILQDNVNKLNMYGYEVTGYCEHIASIADYFRINMSLMSKDVRKELFNPLRPIYTKVRDDMPSRYGLTSKATGSLVAQGCKIDGEVEGSILSKGVTIGKGSVIKNCIIMQDTKIAENCKLSYAIIDKDVVIQANRSLMGYETYPIYIAKQTII